MLNDIFWHNLESIKPGPYKRIPPYRNSEFACVDDVSITSNVGVRHKARLLVHI